MKLAAMIYIGMNDAEEVRILQDFSMLKIRRKHGCGVRMLIPLESFICQLHCDSNRAGKSR